MPELPDVEVYREAMTRFYAGRAVEQVALKSPFVVRTFEPDLFAIEGRRIRGFRRLGKRIVWEFEGELFLVLHLMIAGRLHRKPPGTAPRAKMDLAAFHFGVEADGSGRPADTLTLTEASSKKRASIHLVEGKTPLAAHDPGGLEPLACSLADFRLRLRAGNNTLKRALADPRRFSGVGNAYSDEILHAAGLSPVQRTLKLSDGEVERLHEATQRTLTRWIELLREQTGDGFPEKSPPSTPKWPSTASSASPAPRAVRLCSGFATPTTRRTTALAARPAGACWPTARSRACPRTTGRGRLTSGKRNSATDS